jgi:hypothetical protein
VGIDRDSGPISTRGQGAHAMGPSCVLHYLVPPAHAGRGLVRCALHAGVQRITLYRTGHHATLLMLRH